MSTIRMLTDRGTGGVLWQSRTARLRAFLALNDIEHTKTKAHPQTNGICERFHKTILNEFYQRNITQSI